MTGVLIAAGGLGLLVLVLGSIVMVLLDWWLG